jgi:hypothetical protein
MTSGRESTFFEIMYFAKIHFLQPCFIKGKSPNIVFCQIVLSPREKRKYIIWVAGRHFPMLRARAAHANNILFNNFNN